MCDMMPGERGTALTVRGEKTMRRRLMDLGLVKGSGISCLHRSVMGGVKAYSICGAVIAIRDCDCADVVISL